MKGLNSKKRRLDPSVFQLPVDKIRAGFYSDKYFVRTAQILKADDHHAQVTMQVFTRARGIICGMDEAIAILRLCAENGDQLVIHTLYDGDTMEVNETVMTIEGDYSTFAHLETVYLGVLARASAIASSVRQVVEAARGKEVLFFGARFDRYQVQAADGYAAYVGGASGVSTDAGGLWWQGEGIGTIPHGLIAAYAGDAVAASEAFSRYVPEDVARIALVDFDNHCVKTSLEVGEALKTELWGVRLDTAGDIWDESVRDRTEQSRGVCPELVFNVRGALDKGGFRNVKIVVSGGFTAEKVAKFVKMGVPFDAVGIGSALFQRRIDFTADVVQLEGRPCAKVGRAYMPNPRLALVE